MGGDISSRISALSPVASTSPSVVSTERGLSGRNQGSSSRKKLLASGRLAAAQSAHQRSAVPVPNLPVGRVSAQRAELLTRKLKLQNELLKINMGASGYGASGYADGTSQRSRTGGGNQDTRDVSIRSSIMEAEASRTSKRAPNEAWL